MLPKRSCRLGCVSDALEKVIVATSERCKAQNPIFTAKVPTVTVEMRTEIPKYIAQAIPEGNKIGNMVIAVGTPEKAWILEVRKYLEWWMPDLGVSILDALEMLFHSSESLSSGPIKLLDSRLTITLKGDQITAEITLERLLEVDRIIKILAFLIVTFRPMSAERPTNVMTSNFACFTTDNDTKIRLDLQPLEPYVSNVCWTKVWAGICSPEFPVQDRGDFVGAEISVPVMMTIAEITHVLVMETLSVFTTHDTMIYPVKVTRNHDSIQWHFMDNREEEQPDQWEYETAIHAWIANCVRPKNWMFDDVESLKPARHFLG